MGVQQALRLIPMTKRLREHWILVTTVVSLNPQTKITARPRWLEERTTHVDRVMEFSGGGN
jgi:hypothetical protein